MKNCTILAITGFCGVGKTTTAKIFLKQLPDVALLPCDIYMIEAAVVYKNEFEEIFEIPLDMNDCRYSLSMGINKGDIYFKKYIELINSFVDERVQDEIKKHRTSAQLKFIIIEWGALPILSAWSNADYRIMVDAPKKERNIKLYERPHHPRIPKSDYLHSGERRESAVRSIMEQAQGVDFLLYNTYDEHLEKKVEYLCSKIFKEQNLLLPLKK